ncbi:MAG: class B sortase [Clostridia bacterium]|nr:class B sortase [Clostridia bacterium]
MQKKRRPGAPRRRIQGTRSTQTRYDYYVPETYRRKKEKKLLLAAAMLVCVVVLIVSAVNIFSYLFDFVRSRQASRAMRETYYEELAAEQAAQEQAESAAMTAEQEEAAKEEAAQDAPPQAGAAPENAPAAQESILPQESAAPVASPAPTEKPSYLVPMDYPKNPYAKVTNRFAKLQRQNKDIVGWLKIDGLIDEAVVQRDNEYYLRRDYLGYHNVNGAVFLDQQCRLDTRPYTLLLYAHNMKNGLMFGCLRNYEDIGFYRKNPIITFDTAYENGRYVIFAVGTISLDRTDWAFVDFGKLMSSSIDWREDVLYQLKLNSRYTSVIDVRPDDQILMLVTCVDDDTERRVVAARRIREGEDEQKLYDRLQRVHTQ